MRVMMLLAVVGLSACQPPLPTVETVRADAVTAPAGSMMALINAERAAQGRGPVAEDANLSQAARDHARDMVARGYFSHVSQNGASFSDRARAAGYACAAAENIATGQRSEAEVMAAWMNSAGHRRNILLADAQEYGIGRDGNIWVLMMGRGC